jgi:hypothetical protein
MATNNTAQFMGPYNLVMDLDDHFHKSNQGRLDSDAWLDVVETIQATGCEKNQIRAFELFKILPKTEVIRRAKIVSKLDKLLKRITVNRRVSNYISSPLTNTTESQ